MKMEDIESRLRGDKVRSAWLRLDRLFAGIGAEASSLLIIALALAILCAPFAFILGVTWGVGTWVARASHNAALGWIAAVIVFAFFCRYVWGSRLQRASRRGADAVVRSGT